MKSLEQLVDEVHAEHLAAITPRMRGERRSRPEIYITIPCDRCQKPFTQFRWRKQKHCSQACANSHATKYSLQQLEELARAGVTNREMGRILGMEVNSVRKALIREGLHRTWCMARFKKCQAVSAA